MSETPHDLAHKYVNVYGARPREVSQDFGMSVRDLLHHRTYIKGQCYNISHDFKRWGEANYPNHTYHVVWGSAPATRSEGGMPEFNEHAAVLVDRKHVVDLTRRQFEPNAPVINVMPHKEWRAKHSDEFLDNPAIEEHRMNISKLVRQVAEGQDPNAALVGESFEHHVPRVVESFGAEDLEKMYGGDFDAHSKVREFQPIDTGAGVRIRNITVKPDYHHHDDHDAATLPHARNSRVYVATTDAHKTFAKAIDASGGFFKGDTSAPAPVDSLSHEKEQARGEELPTNVGDGRDNLRGFLSGTSGPISDMMKLRLPENNPHHAWREGVLPHVFKHLGMDGTGANSQPHAQWHKNAGCGTCPCSPGFILHKSNHPLAHGHNIWVEVD